MTYIDRLTEALAGDPHRTVVIDADHEKVYTAAEFTDLIQQIASLLAAQGVEAGDVVALAAPTTAQGLAARYAASRLGCCTVFCPAVHDLVRLRELLEHVSASFLVVFTETAGAAAVPAAVQIVSVGLDLPAARGAEWPDVVVRAEDACILATSGGTTGNFKASIRDWQSYTAVVDVGPNPHRRQLICTPLAYLAQLLADSVLIGGGQVVLQREFDPERTLANMARWQVTDLFLVEPMLVRLVDCERLSTTDLASVKAISHIGADAAPSVRARLLARLGRPMLEHTYGASELGIVSRLAPPEYSLDHPGVLGTAGRVLPGVSVRIVDAAGQRCGSGESGLIQISSAVLASGYATPARAGFGADGWFETGDVGSLDADGYLTIRGRRSDARAVNGNQVFPGDLQQAFCSVPGVTYAVAVPHPNGLAGFGVALTTDAAVDVGAVCAEVRRNSGAHLVPADVVVLDEIPITDQGKPDRSALQALIWGG